jgi:hypothetical protein
MRRLPAALLASLAAAALLAAFAAATRGNAVGCGPRSVGPGSLRRGGTAGAACLLRAFQQGCKTADYKLSLFGVDTVNTEDFRVALRRGRCGVDVTVSFRVVPQQPHITGTRHCALVRRSGGDIVADRCKGGPPSTVSLTSFR